MDDTYNINTVRIFSRDVFYERAVFDLKIGDKKCDIVYRDKSSEYVEYDCKGQKGNTLYASHKTLLNFCGIEVYKEKLSVKCPAGKGGGSKDASYFMISIA